MPCIQATLLLLAYPDNTRTSLLKQMRDLLNHEPCLAHINARITFLQ